MASISVKPPNILVYTGDYPELVYKCIAANLMRCLHPDKYVVYELKKNQVLSIPWKDNVSLLLVHADKIEESVAAAFEEFVTLGGKMLVFCSEFNSKKLGVQSTPKAELKTKNQTKTEVKYKTNVTFLVYLGDYLYTLGNSEILATNTKDKAVVVKSSIGEGILIASEVLLAFDPVILQIKDSNVDIDDGNRLLLKSLLEHDLDLEVVTIQTLTTPALTPAYILVEDGTLVSKLKSIGNISVGPFEDDVKVPLLFQVDDATSILFDKAKYFDALKTNIFGRVAVYFPIVTSTMIPSQHLSEHKHAVVIASRQISGRGRGGNKWISPAGCAMFTLPLTLSLSSQLGSRMSMIQHMASLSVVHGIRKQRGYAEVDLRLKWPNDIYYGKDTKIGGVLVDATIQDSIANARIGIGFNVANAPPTLCINSIIESHNTNTGAALQLLGVETVIAWSLNELENLVDDFSKNGPDNFLKLYYTYWLHDDQKVTVSTHETEAVIQGLDEYGFLVVEKADGKKLTLHPDGNRFDMLKNLIVAKE